MHAVIALCSYWIQWHTCVFSRHAQLKAWAHSHSDDGVILSKNVLLDQSWWWHAFMRGGIGTDMGYLFRHSRCESCRRAAVWTTDVRRCYQCSHVHIGVVESWDKSEQDTALSLGCSAALQSFLEMKTCQRKCFPTDWYRLDSCAVSVKRVSVSKCFQSTLSRKAWEQLIYDSKTHNSWEYETHKPTQQKKYNPLII